MDVFIPIVLFVLVFILFSICGFCCKRKREGTVYGLAGTNVTVTTQQISASPVVVPPYPVEPRHPTPNVGAPGLGFATHNPPYPTHNPHPTGGVPYHPAVGATPYPPVGATPYPPAVGSTPYPPSTGSTPYPPVGGSAPYPDYAAQPPSYSEAVAQPPAQPLPSKDGYSKQAPYNPNY